MSLIKSNTKWVLFLATSSHNPEDRHIYDLAYGLICLESAGVRHNDIFIYIDGLSQNDSLNYFQIATNKKYTVKPTSDFFHELSTNTYKNVVVFVTGHGSDRGIDAAVPITPYALVNSLKSAPELEHCIVYLGQCFAGVFNYVNAGRDKKKADQHDVDIILVGATNLHESLSSSTEETFLNGNFRWVANLFLLHVFKWIASPHDIDGDGKNTIMDSYKYAGVGSNRRTKQSKYNNFGQMVDAYGNYKLALSNFQAGKSNPATSIKNKLALDAAETQYLHSLTTNYIHQECWILNSYPAQKLEL